MPVKMAGGHQLWAAAGTLFEQTLLADGTTTMHELTRHQTKRDTTTRKDGTHRHQFYARYTLNWGSPRLVDTLIA